MSFRDRIQRVFWVAIQERRVSYHSTGTEEGFLVIVTYLRFLNNNPFLGA